MGVQKSAIYEYDFALDGGVIGDINMRLVGGDANPPPGSILEGKNIVLDVLTVPVGATATIALKLENAADIQAAAAISGAPWSTTGIKDPTIEGGLKVVSGNVPLKATVATAALTAGKFRVYISYTTVT